MSNVLLLLSLLTGSAAVRTSITLEEAVEGSLLEEHVWKLSSMDKTTVTCSVHPSKKEINSFVEEHFFKGKEPARNPAAIFTVGGPGAGKSTVVDAAVKLGENSPTNYVLIDPDRILMGLYRKPDGEPDMDCYAPDIEEIRMGIFDRVLSDKYNFIMDGTGKNFVQWSGLAQTAKDAGFTTEAAITVLDVETAIARIKSRAEETDRTVDEDYARSSYEKIEANLDNYKKSGAFAKVYVYDNTGQAPKLVYQRP